MFKWDFYYDLGEGRTDTLDETLQRSLSNPASLLNFIEENYCIENT